MTPVGEMSLFSIDTEKSRFTVRAFASGLLAGLGHNPTLAVRDYSGQINFAAGSLAGASLVIRAKAESLSVQDAVNDKDRSDIESKMKEEVLEVSRFPEIVFQSKQVSGGQLAETLYAVKIEGDIALHGVTRGLAFSAQLVSADDSLRAFGEFSLKQTDFNIKLVSVAGGTLKVKDELKCSFDIVARKQG